jgi:hypothetical protein
MVPHHGTRSTRVYTLYREIGRLIFVHQHTWGHAPWMQIPITLLKLVSHTTNHSSKSSSNLHNHATTGYDAQVAIPAKIKSG